ncbi:MAG TPA: DUF374 domain-containing protein [Gammaproteobacteria bacterium]|nr:DUF374 domain-containing protein [Gammaproteobacteria bacterium]
MSFSQRLLTMLAMIAVRLIYGTCRVVWLWDDELQKMYGLGSSWIFSTWHSNALTGVWVARNRKLGMLVSASGDGDMLAAVIKYFGNCPIRGSSSRGGASGLRQVVRFLHHDPVVFTPDGPRGPLHQVQPGVIGAARLSGVPIIPVHFEANRHWTFTKAWDQQKIAKPFSTIFVGIGDPIVIPEQVDTQTLEAYRDQLQGAMLRLAQKTRAVVDLSTSRAVSKAR